MFRGGIAHLKFKKSWIDKFSYMNKVSQILHHIKDENYLGGNREFSYDSCNAHVKG